MSSEIIPYIPIREFKSDREKPSLRDTIMKYVYHWPLFILSIIICFAIAATYLRYVQPVYKIQAKLLFKSQEKTDSRKSALQELDIFPQNTVVENEIEVIKSRTLMQAVVNDLNLWITYYKAGKVSAIDLYDQTPVKLTLIKKTDSIAAHSFDIYIRDDKRFVLRQGENEIPVPYNSTIKNPYGTWRIERTKFLPRQIGANIKIVVENPGLVTESFMGKLGISVENKLSTIAEVTFSENVPQRGNDVINRLTEVYNRAAVHDKNKATESTLAFIDERLDSVATELNQVEQHVEQFNSSRRLSDIPSQSDFYLDNVKTNDKKLNEVDVQIQVINGIERFVNSNNLGNVPATAGITDPALMTLINQLISLKSQRDRLLATTPEANPVFKPLNLQIETTKQAIRENISEIKSSMMTTKKQLLSFNSGFESSIKKLPGQEREYINIKRQQSIKEELYNYLLKKREEAGLSYASTLSDSRIVDDAYYGDPVWPKRSLIYAFALFMALAFPAGLIYAREVLNDRVVSKAEIEEATSVPILGELFYQRNLKQIVMTDRSCGVIAEQFRILRTNLRYLHGNEKSGRVTMLTSGMSGEGKSFITCNLGAALAASGRKTIILEMDMRKPLVCKYFNMDEQHGLSDYLEGTASQSEIVQPVESQPNLFVIGTGALPVYPAEMLGKPEVPSLIEWLRTRFDEILIDTPPVQLVTDGLIISPFCDVNLYVVRYSFTYKSHLRYINELKNSNKLKNLHIIFNGVVMKGRYTYRQHFEYGNYNSQNDHHKRLSIGPALKGVIERL